MNVKVNGELLKQLRIKHSYSQEKLAEIIGVNLRTIQRVESTGVASLSTRGALANALSVQPEDLDLPEAPTADSKGERLVGLPRWPVLLAGTVLVVLGGAVLAVGIMSATPIGLVTPQAIVGLLIALIGFIALARLTPLRRWRAYAVLSIVVVAVAASPPAWTIQALVAISLWAAFELGILLTRFRIRVQQR
jgi:DNA-binding XRE family transcriptional regulator